MLNKLIQLSNVDILEIKDFFKLLSDSFEKCFESCSFENILTENIVFEKCKETLFNQIKDLKEMDKNGQLKNEQKFFGIVAPSGEIWYNFNVDTYLECGLVGSMEGWDEIENSERIDVNGPTAYINSEGNIDIFDSKELKEEIIDISKITWDMKVDFLYCGKAYE